MRLKKIVQYVPRGRRRGLKRVKRYSRFGRGRGGRGRRRGFLR